MSQYRNANDIKILPAFRRLELPLDSAERAVLEEEILQRGFNQYFFVWHGCLLMNFDAFDICNKHNIKYRIKAKRYPSLEIAVSEVCKMHLKLTVENDMMKKYLIGTRFHVEKELAKQQPQEFDGQFCYDDSAMKTRERLAKEFEVVAHTIYMYGVHAETLSSIADVSEELFLRIMKKEIKVSIETLQAILKLSPTPRQQTIEKLLKGGGNYNDTAKPAPRTNGNNSGERIMGLQSIKEVPKYDPNAELKSLIYTVPTWMSSINRVMKVANMVESDSETKQKLRVELVSMIGVICDFLKEMEDSNNG